MKKFIALLFCSVFSFSLFAGTPIPTPEEVQAEATAKIKAESADLEKAMTSISDALSKTVAPSAVQHNVWADAYIGKVFPALPPHLGAGVSMTTSTIKVDGMNDLLDDADMGFYGDIIKKMGFPLPSANGNIRVGGLFFPFDLGASFMKFKKDDLFDTGMNLDYTTFSIDIRYAILEQSVTKPDLSVGFSYTKSMGSISKAFSISDSTGATLNGSVISAFDTSVYCFFAQVSRSFLGNVITPYAGTRLAFQQGTYGWETALNGSYTSNTITVPLSYKSDYENNVSFGKQPVFQLYGGLGFRGLVFDTSFGVCFDFVSKSFGSNVNFRIVL